MSGDQLVQRAVGTSDSAVPPRTEAECGPAAKLRQREMDAIRGLAILGVVFIHGALFWPIGRAGAISGAVNSLVGLLCVWLHWCVPVFLIISAYFYAGQLERPIVSSPLDRLQYRTRRLRRLAVPFVVWSVVYLLADHEHSPLTLKRLISVHFSGYGWSGQYYFIVLFQLMFLGPSVTRSAVSDRSIMMILGLSVPFFLAVCLLAIKIDILRKIGDRFFLYWLPFWFFGIWFSRNKWRVERLFGGTSSGVICGWCLAASVGPLVEEVAWKRSAPDFGMAYMRVSVLIAAIGIFVGAWIVVRRNLDARFCSIMDLLGRYSLGIFCLNPLMIILLKWCVSRLPVAGATPVCVVPAVPLVNVALIVVCCLLTARFLEGCGAAVLVR